MVGKVLDREKCLTTGSVIDPGEVMHGMSHTNRSVGEVLSLRPAIAEVVTV